MLAASHYLKFYKSLGAGELMPKMSEVRILNPFKEGETWALISRFYHKYYNNSHRRVFLIGINPGRLGAGVTGIPFTDPYHLQEVCDIEHDFPLKQEISSLFIYELIDKLGGPDIFYKHFYVTSACPLGFVKGKKNYNYYDDKILLNAVEPLIVRSLYFQSKHFCNNAIAYSLGKGKNYNYLRLLNDKHGWFDDILPLPHPRWIMQYQRTNKLQYLDTYADALSVWT